VPDWTDQDQEDLDKYTELRQTGTPEYDARVLSKVHNAPLPIACPECGSEPKTGSGYVGESLLYCDNPDCSKSILWEDQEGVMARIL